MEEGKVWLVGAGPGDVGLLTLKGKAVLEMAQVVIYDSLIGDAILAMVPDSAEKIDAGKRASFHHRSQWETNRLLVEKAAEGKRVVRLKGGDPFLFGRGGEEIELLKENGIAYEIVPGVTSAIAVPAYNGIPVTHRDYSSSVHIITAHRRSDIQNQSGQVNPSLVSRGVGEEHLDILKSTQKDHMPISGIHETAKRLSGADNFEAPCHDGKIAGDVPTYSSIDFNLLAKAKGTLIFLMGVSALPDICNGLLNAGMDGDTPAAVLQKGTTAGQKRIVATISTIVSEAKQEGIEAPAIIVVGKVCQLARRFAWYEDLPLSGTKVLVTRPKGLASELTFKLRYLGSEVVELPSIETKVIEENASFDNAILNLCLYDWIVFTSPTGVRVFFERLLQSQTDIRSLGNAKIAAIGEGSRKALRKRGIIADLVPEVYDGDHLGKALKAVLKRGEKILVPRAEAGNQILIKHLKEAGAEVSDIPTYRTVYHITGMPDESALFFEGSGSVDCVVFTSSSSVQGFLESTAGLDHTKVRAACIGKQTAAAAREAGMKVEIADRATMDSLVELVEKMLLKR